MINIVLAFFIALGFMTLLRFLEEIFIAAVKVVKKKWLI